MLHTPSKMSKLALAALALLITAGAAQAKTLVFCSEGSPENFYPCLLYTSPSPRD